MLGGEKTAKQIAEKYYIPQTTLSEKVTGHHVGKRGHNTLLHETNEGRIAECFIFAVGP